MRLKNEPRCRAQSLESRARGRGLSPLVRSPSWRWVSVQGRAPRRYAYGAPAPVSSAQWGRGTRRVGSAALFFASSYSCMDVFSHLAFSATRAEREARAVRGTLQAAARRVGARLVPPVERLDEFSAVQQSAGGDRPTANWNGTQHSDTRGVDRRVRRPADCRLPAAPTTAPLTSSLCAMHVAHLPHEWRALPPAPWSPPRRSELSLSHSSVWVVASTPIVCTVCVR